MAVIPCLPPPWGVFNAVPGLVPYSCCFCLVGHAAPGKGHCIKAAAPVGYCKTARSVGGHDRATFLNQAHLFAMDDNQEASQTLPSISNISFFGWSLQINALTVSSLQSCYGMGFDSVTSKEWNALRCKETTLCHWVRTC